MFFWSKISNPPPAKFTPHCRFIPTNFLKSPTPHSFQILRILWTPQNIGGCLLWWTSFEHNGLKFAVIRQKKESKNCYNFDWITKNSYQRIILRRLFVLNTFFQDDFNDDLADIYLFKIKQWKQQNNVWNLYNVNNKDIRMTSMTYWSTCQRRRMNNVARIPQNYLRWRAYQQQSSVNYCCKALHLECLSGPHYTSKTPPPSFQQDT